jgi:hypothetical protein
MPTTQYTYDDHGREHHAHHGHAAERDAPTPSMSNEHEMRREHQREWEVREGAADKHGKLPRDEANELKHQGGHHHCGPEARDLVENTKLAGLGR